MKLDFKILEPGIERAEFYNDYVIYRYKGDCYTSIRDIKLVKQMESEAK